MESQPEGSKPRPKEPKLAPPRFNTTTLWVLVVLILVLGLLYFQGTLPQRAEISYGTFRRELEADNITEAKAKGMTFYGKFKDPPADPKSEKGEKLPEDFSLDLPVSALADSELDRLLLEKLGDEYSAEEPTDNTGMLLVVYLLVTIFLFVGVWFMFRRTRDQMLGGGILGGFSKSPAKRYQLGEKPVTFADVAGLEGVKNDLQEVVDFLKDPKKFQRLGGRVPKGVLLNGPPGTGKTLLGRAVAGEADVPFFSITGSEFIQMFVGVGASRVRDMFATAKENAPAILFIDEIDAVGRHRGTGLGGGHDEREQTLNQILSEMDGFSPTESVIVMAATNRPDVLDPALLRPGRFDRHVIVDRPNRKARKAIFEVHSRDVPLADDVDIERLAAGSVGLTGADISNLVNEAAIYATRQGKDHVEMEDFDHARDKVLMGSKRDEVLTGHQKVLTAYHEAGHALVVWLLPFGEHVHKVSIIPRGRTLGATQVMGEEDRLNISESELHAQLAFLLAGRMAEKLQFDELSAGAENDLKTATQVARGMVTHWGMSERLGPVAFRAGERHPFLGKEMAEPREFSEHTARVIDEEVTRILRAAADRAEQILREHRDKLDLLATTLEREETLDDHQIESLIGPPARKPGNSSTEGTDDADPNRHFS